MDYKYWQRQTPETPLFPNIEWNKPEQKSRAGNLGIIGGNKLGFRAVAESYEQALAAGVGNVRVVLPNALKTSVPTTMTDVVFAPSNIAGSLANDAEANLHALGEWANGVLLIGDAGRSSETALVYDKFIEHYTKPLTITRDAVDLVRNNPNLVVERPDTLLVVSFAQAQKLFRGVYYPKMLTFSMQLQQLVEALHKFTITYPCTIMTLHHEQVIVAHGGKVVTTKWTDPTRIWRGSVATQAASYWLWSPDKPLESITSSLL